MSVAVLRIALLGENYEEVEIYQRVYRGACMHDKPQSLYPDRPVPIDLRDTRVSCDIMEECEIWALT